MTICCKVTEGAVMHVATVEPVGGANSTNGVEPTISPISPITSSVASTDTHDSNDIQANVLKPTIIALDVDEWIYQWGFWQYKLVVQTASRQIETYVCRFSSLHELTKSILQDINASSAVSSAAFATPTLTDSDEDLADTDTSQGTQKEEHIECKSEVRFELPDSTVPKFPQTHWCGAVGKWCDNRAVTQERVADILKVLHYIEMHSTDAHFALHTQIQKLPLASTATVQK